LMSPLVGIAEIFEREKHWFLLVRRHHTSTAEAFSSILCWRHDYSESHWYFRATILCKISQFCSRKGIAGLNIFHSKQTRGHRTCRSRALRGGPSYGLKADNPDPDDSLEAYWSPSSSDLAFREEYSVEDSISLVSLLCLRLQHRKTPKLFLVTFHSNWIQSWALNAQ
jgi:hypothetical protein